MLLRSLFTAMLVLMMTGCANLTPRSEPAPIQASLRQPCPELDPLSDITGKAVLKWSVATVKAYRLCADKMDALIDATAAATPAKP